LAWLVFAAADGGRVLGSSQSETWLLVLSGIVSTTPLLLFTSAARRLRYSTLGMLQFAAPTLQFLLAVVIYDEEFTQAHAIAFASIWSALALYVTSLVRDFRAQRSAAQATDLSEC
jgi:chloramphenicol-sensitive protein RarD